ncbi:13475_t:CDS:2 [Ambispora leptoticha]|uniref:13475_t:CDS:1 n=1 Tax=Ambispora leptoticha TaxID=144679 RepID=A0A9N9BN33_9GLOM|nr:13475_t:CDS:2 [Ambispora leptoticha]
MTVRSWSMVISSSTFKQSMNANSIVISDASIFTGKVDGLIRNNPKFTVELKDPEDGWKIINSQFNLIETKTKWPSPENCDQSQHSLPAGMIAWVKNLYGININLGVN